MNDLSREMTDQLVAAALEARGSAYAHYSGFSVGAALLTADGQIFRGVNVENASYGLTLCAERSAVVAAVSAGCREFLAIAVATPRGDAPCGACRQVLAEFAPNLLVLLVAADAPQSVARVRLGELLPSRFDLPKA